MRRQIAKEEAEAVKQKIIDATKAQDRKDMMQDIQLSSGDHCGVWPGYVLACSVGYIERAVEMSEDKTLGVLDRILTYDR